MLKCTLIIPVCDTLLFCEKIVSTAGFTTEQMKASHHPSETQAISQSAKQSHLVPEPILTVFCTIFLSLDFHHPCLCCNCNFLGFVWLCQVLDKKINPSGMTLTFKMRLTIFPLWNTCSNNLPEQSMTVRHSRHCVWSLAQSREWQE